MKVQARLKNYRRSARKVRELTPLIKGLRASDAILQLENARKGAAEDLKVLLLSAIANAQNNFKLNKENLFVENVLVDEGKVMKRWRPRAYGRAAQILKRSCHVLLSLEEVKDDSRKKKVTDKKVKSSTVEKKEVLKGKDIKKD